MNGAAIERLRLDPVTSSPAAARRWVTTELAGFPDDVVEVAALLTTELVTNAVLHAKTALHVAIERREDRVRIEVIDESPILPQTRRYGEFAGTGRGLKLVDSMAAGWGAETRAEGKVVYFDLSLLEGRALPPAAAPADLFDLDAWPDLEEPDAPAGAEIADDGVLVSVTLLGVPLPLMQRASEQYDTLAREFALILDQRPEERDRVPGRLLTLMEDLTTRFGSFTSSTTEEYEAALERGDATIDLSYRLPADVGPATLEYDALLDEADAYCRAGALLTVAASPEAVAVRKWFLFEFVAQAGGQPPEPWAGSAWARGLADRTTEQAP